MLQCPKCGRRYSASVTTCPEDGTPLRADSTVAANVNVTAHDNVFDVKSKYEDPLINQILDDKYRLESLLGTGGMGSVYRATHLLIERSVAVKVLNPRLVTDEAAQERLRREARAAGRLRHSGAVAVTDFGQTKDGTIYIVMELLEGISLREMLMKHAPLEPSLAVALMMQAASAVAAAHEIGIIHRDLKPGNIFIIERHGQIPLVKVLDFGIAKVAHDKEATDIHNVMTLTETGVLIGTPRYMSPEQCDGQPLTPASDVYSLGVILYEMLTGSPPFTGVSALAIALQHSAQIPRPLRELNTLIPPEIETIVLSALNKKPLDRFADAAAFHRELSDAAQIAGINIGGGFASPTSEIKSEISDAQATNENSFGKARGVSTAANNAPTTADGNQSAREKIEITPAVQSGKFVSQPARKTSPAIDEATRVQVSRKSNLNISIGAIALIVVVGLLFAASRLFDNSSSNENSDASVNQNLTNNQSDSNNDEAQSIGRNLLNTNANATNSAALRRQKEPRTAAEFYERASYYFSTRDFKRAADDYRRAVELQPDFPVAHNRLGQTLMQNAQFGAAVQEFQKAIEQRPDFAAAHYNLGYALQQRNDMTGAIAAYQKAIETNKGIYPDAYYQQGIASLALKRDAEAAAALTKAIEQNNGNDYDAHFALGVALARQNKFDEAEAAFRRAIEQRGSFADANYNLGLLYENSNRPNDAVREYETYLQQQPNAFNRRLVENSLRRLRNK